jgi:elongator complex protein 1
MTEFLADMKTQLTVQVPRLRELRAKKAEDPFAFFEGGEGGEGIPDNVSVAPTETTSGGTFMTQYTNRTSTVNTATTRKTSKKKRQEERKRARGKKGTVYEEEYLVNSIERLIERLNSTNDEVMRLVEGLTKRQMRERADAVDRAVRDVVNKCQEAVAEMYVKEEGAVPGDGGINGVGGAIPGGVDGKEQAALKPQGADATLWDSIEEVNRKREPPIVKAFERLSLLG